MLTRSKHYSECVSICATTDYGSASAVRRHNAAADRMREIVIQAEQEGPEAIAELLPLLDDPTASRWLAFQLLKLCNLTDANSRKCLAIIEQIAAGNGVEALGARLWLQEHRDGPDRS